MQSCLAAQTAKRRHHFGVLSPVEIHCKCRFPFGFPGAPAQSQHLRERPVRFEPMWIRVNCRPKRPFGMREIVLRRINGRSVVPRVARVLGFASGAIRRCAGLRQSLNLRQWIRAC